MAFFNQINSRQNEPSDYYRISFTFFCSDFAAYVRENTVSYGFYDNQGRPIFRGENIAAAVLRAICPVPSPPGTK